MIICDKRNEKCLCVGDIGPGNTFELSNDDDDSIYIMTNYETSAIIRCVDLQSGILCEIGKNRNEKIVESKVVLE